MYRPPCTLSTSNRTERGRLVSGQARLSITQRIMCNYRHNSQHASRTGPCVAGERIVRCLALRVPGIRGARATWDGATVGSSVARVQLARVRSQARARAAKHAYLHLRPITARASHLHARACARRTNQMLGLCMCPFSASTTTLVAALAICNLLWHTHDVYVKGGNRPIKVCLLHQ